KPPNAANASRSRLPTKHAEDYRVPVPHTPPELHDDDPQAVRARFDAATAEIDPPFAVVDITAFDANAAALEKRANGTPIRVASKSVRSRELLQRVLARPGWQGVMAFTVPEAMWLVRTGISDDILVAYPSADRSALQSLATHAELASAITIMVDSIDQ